MVDERGMLDEFRTAAVVVNNDDLLRAVQQGGIFNKARLMRAREPPEGCWS